MATARSLFLRFSSEEVLDSTPYGQILRRRGDVARVYILGVVANEEPAFLFSYNITSLTETAKKKLNRERLNVGRTTYVDRVKTILRTAKSKVVKDLLVEEVTKRSTGDQCDEMSWIEISNMALNLMHERQNVVYLTDEEIQTRPNILDNVRSDGYQVVAITEQQKAKLERQAEAGGPQVQILEAYVKLYNSSFDYQFVEPENLSKSERVVLAFTKHILALVGITGPCVPEVRISETMRVGTADTEGVWDPGLQAIVIKRSSLVNFVGYAATLLHEAAHATTGTEDATREFERVLTDYLGRTSLAAIVH